MNKLSSTYFGAVKFSQIADFLSPLLFRAILAPVMIIAGYNKLRLGDQEANFLEQLLPKQHIVDWFGNSEWGLGLPAPDLLAFLAGWTEFGGGWLLLLGLGVRVVAVPLMVTMLVAAFTVHWDNGWHAIAPSNGATSPAMVLHWLGIDAGTASLQNSDEVATRLGRIKDILETHGRTDYLYGRGGVVILNNGIQFAVLYFGMLLSLFFTGAGRWLSLDYWISRGIKPQ